LLEKKECIGVVTIDEAHKIFDRLPKYRPAFNDMRKLQQLSCPIIAMSATLTGGQVSILQQRYLRDNTLVLQSSTQHQNFQFKIQMYKRYKQQICSHPDINDDDDEEEEISEDVVYVGTTLSMWQSVVNQIQATIEGKSSVGFCEGCK